MKNRQVDGDRPVELDGDAADTLAAMFRLLGDPGRVRLLHALLHDGELCVTDLAVRAGVSETAVSHSLRLLRTAGIVRSRRDGRQVLTRLDDDHVAALLDLAIRHVGHGHDHPLDIEEPG